MIAVQENQSPHASQASDNKHSPQKRLVECDMQHDQRALERAELSCLRCCSTAQVPSWDRRMPSVSSLGHAGQRQISRFAGHRQAHRRFWWQGMSTSVLSSVPMPGQSPARSHPGWGRGPYLRKARGARRSVTVGCTHMPVAVGRAQLVQTHTIHRIVQLLCTSSSTASPDAFSMHSTCNSTHPRARRPQGSLTELAEDQLAAASLVDEDLKGPRLGQVGDDHVAQEENRHDGLRQARFRGHRQSQGWSIRTGGGALKAARETEKSACSLWDGTE